MTNIIATVRPWGVYRPSRNLISPPVAVAHYATMQDAYRHLFEQIPQDDQPDAWIENVDTGESFTC